MKKFIPATILFSILSFQTFALDIEISGNLGDITSTNKQITLYNFSDSLLKATENCTAYSEDFAENNPQIASLAELFGGNEWKILINIEGFNQDKLCHFNVSQKAGDITLAEYDCLASAEQMSELHKAMLNRSTQPVTETFTTYAEISDGAGNFQKTPIETTMTDSLFNIIWAKISDAVCTRKQEEADENSQKNFLDNYNKFSAAFIEDLQNCRPSQETKSMLFMSETVTVLNKENNLCKISYPPFELQLPDEELKKITSLEQIKNLAADTTYSRYIPEYQNNGLLFLLDKCTHNQSPTSNNGMSRTQSNEFMQIYQDLTAKYNDNECIVTFGNKLTINNVEKDYSRICSLKAEKITSLLLPYQQLLEQNREKTTKNADNSYSFRSEISDEATNAADKELEENLLKLNLCHLISEK